MADPAITIIIDGKSDGLSKELNAIQKNLTNFGNTAESSSRKAGRAFDGLTRKIVGMVAAFVAVKKGIGLFQKAIGISAESEALETQFATLLGGVGAAQERMEELIQFAATTPFDIPGVGKASKILETLTNGALSTGRGLRFVGDIAAFSGESFKDMSVHVGRLFSGLNQGTEVGESMKRMQELGLISNETRLAIKALQAEGKAGNQVWKVAAKDLARFGGAMEKLSSTFTGQMSNLQDAWDQFLKSFADPIIETVTPMLGRIGDMLSSFQGEAANFGNTIAKVIGKVEAAITNIITIIKNGELKNLLVLSFKFGAAQAMDILTRGISALVSYIGTVVAGQAKTLWTFLSDPSLWKAIGAQLKNIFQGLANVIANAIAPLVKKIPGVNDDSIDAGLIAGDNAAADAAYEARKAWESVDVDPLLEGLIDAQLAGVEAGVAAWQDVDASNILRDLQDELGSTLFAALDRGPQFVGPIQEGGGFIPEGLEDKTVDGKGKGKVGLGRLGIGDSLTSIGGGGNFGVGAPVTISQKQLAAQEAANKKLDTLIREVKDGGLSVSTR